MEKVHFFSLCCSVSTLWRLNHACFAPSRKDCSEALLAQERGFQLSRKSSKRRRVVLRCVLVLHTTPWPQLQRFLPRALRGLQVPIRKNTTYATQSLDTAVIIGLATTVKS